jgi:hypothetical protein
MEALFAMRMGPISISPAFIRVCGSRNSICPQDYGTIFEENLSGELFCRSILSRVRN